jgi:hypothetical protein
MAELERRRLRVISKEIAQLKGVVGRGVYEIGVRLAEVQSEALWRADHESFEAYLRDAVDVGRSSAYQLIRVAKHFNAAIADRYGIDKLDALLRLMSVTPTEERPGDILAAKVTVQDAGRFRALSVHAASAHQIRAAARLVQARNRGRRGPRGMKAERAALEARLPPAPAGAARAGRVRMSSTADGRIAVTFAAVPHDELEAFARAILAHVKERKNKV